MTNNAANALDRLIEKWRGSEDIMPAAHFADELQATLAHPDALTSSAEPVACDVVNPSGGTVAHRVPIDYADELLSKWEWSDCRKTNFLFTHPAADAPSPAVDERCQRVMRERGKPYPRTCYVCGIRGDCVTPDATIRALSPAKENGRG